MTMTSMYEVVSVASVASDENYADHYEELEGAADIYVLNYYTACEGKVTELDLTKTSFFEGKVAELYGMVSGMNRAIVEDMHVYRNDGKLYVIAEEFEEKMQ